MVNREEQYERLLREGSPQHLTLVSRAIVLGWLLPYGVAIPFVLIYFGGIMLGWWDVSIYSGTIYLYVFAFCGVYIFHTIGGLMMARVPVLSKGEQSDESFDSSKDTQVVGSPLTIFVIFAAMLLQAFTGLVVVGDHSSNVDLFLTLIPFSFFLMPFFAEVAIGIHMRKIEPRWRCISEHALPVFVATPYFCYVILMFSAIIGFSVEDPRDAFYGPGFGAICMCPCVFLIFTHWLKIERLRRQQLKYTMHMKDPEFSEAEKERQDLF